MLVREKIFVAFQNDNRSELNRKYSVDESFFETIDTEEKAYILGFITADGYVADNRLKISLNEKDVDILEKIRTCLKSEHPIKYFVKDKKYNHVSLDIPSVKICSDLRKFDLQANKSLTMPNIMKHIPKHLQVAFLRGYFDGDGNIFYGVRYSSGIKYSITVIGTKEFLETSFDRVFKTNCKISKYASCDMYAWKIAAKSQVDEFLDILYKDATIYLNRKYESAHTKLP